MNCPKLSQQVTGRGTTWPGYSESTTFKRPISSIRKLLLIIYYVPPLLLMPTAPFPTCIGVLLWGFQEERRPNNLQSLGTGSPKEDPSWHLVGPQWAGDDNVIIAFKVLVLILNTTKPGRDTVLPRNSETLYMSKFSGWLKVLKLRILLRVKGSEAMPWKKMNHVIERRTVEAT